MKKFLRLSFLFLGVFGSLGSIRLWAGPADWSFLPASTVFQPLIGMPREPIMGLAAFLNQLRYEGQAAGTLEIVRYSPEENLRFGWGLFASAFILLDEDGATFPMRDGDFYIGTYFSGEFGLFSARLEGLHESTHLGDSLQGQQLPLFYSPTVNYSRENVNGTLSFEPSESLRFYAGAGGWDLPLFNYGSNPLFTFLGGEVYSPSWSIDQSSMRFYFTGSLQWVGDTGAWDKELQWGLQWKSATSSRDIRTALIFYSGDSQWGQFYGQFDQHWALSTFFDF